MMMRRGFISIFFSGSQGGSPSRSLFIMMFEHATLSGIEARKQDPRERDRLRFVRQTEEKKRKEIKSHFTYDLSRGRQGT